MVRAAYFDLFSGCSGDMIIGSLLDAGLDLEVLKKGLGSLDFSGYKLSAAKVVRSSITATKFDVILDEAEPGHDHDHHHDHEHSHEHELSYEHEHVHEDEHTHEDEHGHEHEHTHEHEHSHEPTPHAHRGLTEILEIINSGNLSENVKTKSSAIFRKLGMVEAGIHGVPLEEVHFHELGAIDTIVDIVGTVLALETLKIDTVYASPLATGSGTVKTAHGVLPVPAPATLQILADAGAPIVPAPPSDTPPGELLTPTGAVLITSLAAGYTRPNFKVDKVGYGAGYKQFPGWPNVVRVWIGEEDSAEAAAPMGESGDMVLLETNIDDMNPQIYGYLMETLLGAKAADVWFTPIQMKKNRPAIMLSVLGPAALEEKFTEIIMRETSTLGVRSRPITRHTAHREIFEFTSSLGLAHVKVKRYGDFLSVSPEFDDCRRISLEKGLPLQEVSRIIESEARLKL